VRFAEPIRFTNGAILSEFDLEASTLTKGLVFIDPETRNRYRITGARKLARTIVACEATEQAAR
jgi:hypothetical protein